MKKFYSFLILLIILIIGCAKTSSKNELQGTAEDLWGNKINLGDYKKGITLIQPFSPANCGYCLVDGFFVEKNYFENNKKFGGTNFYQCLFNPQLDIYSYIKHYRDEATTVLTFPPMLHKYHRDGFPFIIAFNDGKIIYNRGLHPYEETFQKLKNTFWPKHNVLLKPTSPLHMASRFVVENKNYLAVDIVPDGDKERYERYKKINEKWSRVKVKYESEISEDDLKKNLDFEGITDNFKFTMLENTDIPITFTHSNIKIGDYTFPKSDIGLNICFPNPYNRERYVVMNIIGKNVQNNLFENWVDFTIYQNRVDKSGLEVILHGFFKKSDDNHWTFSDSLTYSSVDLKSFCKNGICPTPIQYFKKLETHKREIKISRPKNTSRGEITTLGDSNCRFPSITLDNKGICWVVWEEEGDILLASVNQKKNQKIVIENNSSDSFNPIITSDSNFIWIFYLNNQDGFYRLYGKSFDGNRLSDEILFTEKEPFDVITPAVTSNQKGKMVLMWSEWKANYRYMRYRIINNRILGKIQSVAIKKSDIDYTNAWFPSLVMEEKGKIWGAWNQHYPATLGVCAGNLVEEAKSVTRLKGDEKTEENGGYPSITIDKEGKKWVLWESFGWDVVWPGKSQNILASYYDEKSEQWSLPYTLTHEKEIVFNQTPRAAVDENGTIWVVWCRRTDENEPWSIYLSYFTDGNWSEPVMISEEGENARAPQICISKENKIWITWHSGIGRNMKIKILKFNPKTLE